MLSTPHGTLGTGEIGKPYPKGWGKAFNSTRYIRNGNDKLIIETRKYLSTPHGTLGTVLALGFYKAMKSFQLHTVH